MTDIQLPPPIYNLETHIEPPPPPYVNLYTNSQLINKIKHTRNETYILILLNSILLILLLYFNQMNKYYIFGVLIFTFIGYYGIFKHNNTTIILYTLYTFITTIIFIYQLIINIYGEVDMTLLHLFTILLFIYIILKMVKYSIYLSKLTPNDIIQLRLG